MVFEDVSYWMGVSSDERTGIPANVELAANDLATFYLVLSIADALLADIVPWTLIEPVLTFLI